jgi:hypothetical protein
MKQGQINLSTKAGKVIYDICSQEDVNCIVEIGTWNGYGSTQCVYEAIKGTNKKLLSFEIDKNMHDEAVSFYKDKPEVQIFCGYISNRFVDLSSLEEMFFTDYSIEVKKQWLDYDAINIKKCQCMLTNVPEEIDFLILDGGEFNSFYEYEILKSRSTYIFCDDTKAPCIKNYKTRLDLIENHDLIVDNQKERHGFCLAKTK